eukprot:CAMPEP_0172323846 /NCGR_PEP_ID=MMETSP1058-20130122/49757_1 /TAXON_ID=83371 /ORGANISM="Detonula confervacea, Strain CCMP 353" /LENGTH=193 /DNA_ID=CAMNT_0013039955 /DNA_START=542 /DNA_END=1120 /DNA_ORIENTATION=-
MSRALFEYNIRTLCGTCECAGNCHYCNERLLHEMADWAVMPDEKDKENIKVSTERKNSGTFPDLFHFHGKLAFVAPATEGGIMAAPFVCTTNTPAAEVQRFEEYMASGLVLDASAAQYAICRKIYSLSLLVKLFDEYQVKVRRTLPINPMERLMDAATAIIPVRKDLQNSALSARHLGFAVTAAWLPRDINDV